MHRKKQFADLSESALRRFPPFRGGGKRVIRNYAPNIPLSQNFPIHAAREITAQNSFQFRGTRRYNCGVKNKMNLPVLLLFAAFASSAMFASADAAQCPFFGCPPEQLISFGECRGPVSCPENAEPIGGGYCVLNCPAGQQPNPFDERACRAEFSCPPGQVEIADRQCECEAPAVEADGQCKQPSFANCDQAGLVYNAVSRRCETPTAEKCQSAGMEFRADQNQCACPGETMQVGETESRCELRCGPGREPNPDAPNTCRAMCPANETRNSQGACECMDPNIQVNGQCTPPSAASCPAAGLLYDANTKQCRAPSADACSDAGMVYLPTQGACVAQCPPGLEAENNECADPCGDRVPEGLPPPPNGFCETDRSLGALSINLPHAHAITLADGTPLLGQGVTVAVVEPGFLHWHTITASAGDDPDDTISSGGPPPSSARPTPSDIKTHSELPSIRVFGYSTDTDNFALKGTPTGADHAIAVMGVMAAKRNGRGLTGVAPEADYFFGNTDGTLALRHLYDRLDRAGAKIINNSWGALAPLRADDFRAFDFNGDLDMTQTRQNINNFLRFRLFGNLGEIPPVDILSFARVYPNPADRPIHVWAAGNDNGYVVREKRGGRPLHLDYRDLGGPLLRVGQVIRADTPSLPAGLHPYFPVLTLNNLAVASVNEFDLTMHLTPNGRGGMMTLTQAPIASSSARCGPGGRAFCLAAPGVARIDFSFLDEEERDAIVLQFPCVPSGDCHFGELLAIDQVLASLRFSHGRGAGFLLAPEAGKSYVRNYHEIPDGYDGGSGTSFAAPLVSGALALMRQYFSRATDCGLGDLCGLGSHELVRRILATADRSGIYADEAIYGAGLLDLRNALTPQGDLRLLSGRSLGDSDSHWLSESGFRPGAALGDSAGRALRGRMMAAFDGMGAPFPVSADSVLRGSSASRETLGAALRRRRLAGLGGGSGGGRLAVQEGGAGAFWWSLSAAGDSRFAFGGGAAAGSFGALGAFEAGANPYSALAGRGVVAGGAFRLGGGGAFRAALFGEGLGGGRVRGMLAEFSFSPPADGRGLGWFLQAGGLRESEGILDSSGSGLFGGLGSRTGFAGLGFAGGLGEGWRYRAGAHWGRTSADDDSGAWFSSTDSLRSGGYAAGLERADVWRSGDGLRLGFRQPLRGSGGLNLRVPTGRTRYGDLTWSEVSASPSGRELEWEARYHRPYAGGRWSVSASLVSQPGHRADAKAEGRALLAFEQSF